jgi:hypothetical protein
MEITTPTVKNAMVVNGEIISPPVAKVDETVNKGGSCKHFKSGNCRAGDKCPFKHDKAENEGSAKMPKFHSDKVKRPPRKKDDTVTFHNGTSSN